MNIMPEGKGIKKGSACSCFWDSIGARTNNEVCLWALGLKEATTTRGLPLRRRCFGVEREVGSGGVQDFYNPPHSPLDSGDGGASSAVIGRPQSTWELRTSKKRGPRSDLAGALGTV